MELPADSPVLYLPWIITIGPLTDEEEWEAIVVGPYEHGHALAIAEEIVADDQIMAVVEPVAPLISVDAIRDEVAAARAAALEMAGDEDDDDADSDAGYGMPAVDVAADTNHDLGVHPGPLTSDEIRAGVARVAARLLAENLDDIIDDVD